MVADERDAASVFPVRGIPGKISLRVNRLLPLA
jgi:hypothetical protein